jgi:hypothetical protein
MGLDREQLDTLPVFLLKIWQFEPERRLEVAETPGLLAALRQMLVESEHPSPSNNLMGNGAQGRKIGGDLDPVSLVQRIHVVLELIAYLFNCGVDSVHTLGLPAWGCVARHFRSAVPL